MSTQIAPVGVQVPVAESALARASSAVAPVQSAAANAVQELQEAKKVDLKSLQKIVQEAIDGLNEQMREGNRSLNFSMDAQVNRVVITVRNTESGEVVRQIPDEAILRVAHNLKKIRGLLLNEEV